MSAKSIVIFGVSGSGKTTVGRALSDALSVPFIDADNFHSAANKAKMASGIPLTDADRWPWLDASGQALAKATQDTGGGVLACSPLKSVYRDRIETASSLRPIWVYLHGSRELLEARLAEQTGHFFDPNLLESQLLTLEPPKDAISINIAHDVPTIVRQILSTI